MVGALIMISTRGITLRDIDLKTEYNTEDDDIIRDLYAPCLSVSRQYDRVAGYFRANIYKELGEALLDFAIRGGKARILCSPDIHQEDEDAVREGYVLRGQRCKEDIEFDLIKLFKIMSKNPKELDCLNMIRCLIENGSLDLYIAQKEGGIYHRKIGIFYDSHGNNVVFSGSGNETLRAVSSIEDWNNDEEFDLYRSWGGEFESSKALKKAMYLERLFNGKSKGIDVRPLNELERKALNEFRAYSNLEECRIGAKMRDIPRIKGLAPATISLYYYQSQAIKEWNNAGRIGILSMATGTGKTITALSAISGLVKEGRAILILVPSKILLSQWRQQISNFFPNVPLLLAGGGHNWKDNIAKRIFISNYRLPRIILATMGTASTPDFIEYLRQSKDPILVVDEVHRLGSISNRCILSIGFKEKLGLSATPERLFDPEGDDFLKNIFGLVPVYNLPLCGKVRLSETDDKEVPIIGKFLSRYDYDFEIVYLTEGEQDQWNNITQDIRKTAGKYSANGQDDFRLIKDKRLLNLFIKRARIQKNAISKIEISRSIIEKRYPSNGRWIIYCDNITQMDSVAKILRSSIKYTPIWTYHSKMVRAKKDAVLKYLENQPGIVVSIKCLDEGVDIPSIDGALILASSTNPREYIQRRGRVLRISNGKRKASIIDVIVLPNYILDEKDLLPMVRSELARAWEFANLAENKDVLHRLWRLCEKCGINVNSDAQLSIYEDYEE